MISRDELIKEIDRKKEELISLCSDLIRINTENPPCKTEAICEYISRYFKEADIPYNTYEPDPGKVSIVGNIEGSSNKTLIFNGHLDVVPAGDLKAWNFEPFGGIVENGKIWGRGSSDMKTKIASAMFAARILKGKGIIPKGNITLMFTADEETGGAYGTKYLIEEGIRCLHYRRIGR